MSIKLFGTWTLSHNRLILRRGLRWGRALKNFEFFSPFNLELSKALASAKIIGIGAHSDDLDFMCLSAIEAGRKAGASNFLGVVVSDGSGSTRGEAFKDLSPAAFAEVRKREQREAATWASYSGVIQLNHSSALIRQAKAEKLESDFLEIFGNGKIETVFTHSPFDRHPTHRALCVHLLRALQKLPKSRRPKKVIGCEVWRSLDWIPASKKIIFPVSSSESQMKTLFDLYQSQIVGAKNYTQAVIGRKRSNATFSESHLADNSAFAEYGIDLTAVATGKITLQKYAQQMLDLFQQEILKELKPYRETSNGNHHRKKPIKRIKSRSKSRR